MALETGTATDALDLFRKLRAFALNASKGSWDPILGGAAHTDYEAFEYSRYSGSAGYEIFDGSSESYSYLYDGDSATFRFASDTQIGSVDLTMPSLSGGGVLAASPSDFSLYTSSDGITWNLAQSWTSPVWNDSETRTFTVSSPATAKWGKFVMNGSNSGSRAYLAELQLFNSSRVRHYVNTQFSKTISKTAETYISSQFETNNIKAHVGLSLYENDADNLYAIGLKGYADVTDYVEPASDLPRTTGHSPSSETYFFVRNAPMDYWFYGDYRSVTGAVRVGSTTRSFSFGYMLAYGTPAQYQLPMYVGAENSSLSYTSETDNRGDVRSFTNPGNGSLYVFSPKNEWEEAQNYIHDTGSAGSEKLQPTAVCVWPGNLAYYNRLRNSPGTNDSNGNYILLPLVVKETNESIYGEIPNVYLVPGLNIASGDVIQIGGDNYRVFNNIWRTSKQDFFAIKEV